MEAWARRRRAARGWDSAFLDAFHGRMLQNSVPCLEPPTLQFGARLARYSGPDGMVFTVSAESR